MAAPGDDAASLVSANAAALPQKPSNPQGVLEGSTGSPQIKPDPVPDTVTSSASDVAAPPPISHSSSRRALRDGPSPQKGSGQDRFRQMITGQAVGKALPLGPPTMYPQLPGLNAQGAQVAAYYPGLSLVKAADTSRTASVNPPRAESMPAPHRNAAGVNLGVNNGNSGTNGGGGDSRGIILKTTNSGRVVRHSDTATLSLECQARRFNPQFKEWGKDGMYYAKVKLLDHIIHDGRAHETTTEAKQAVAKQAIAWIRAHMPKDATQSHTAAAAAIVKQEQASRGQPSNGFYYDTGAGNGNTNGNGTGTGNGGSGGGFGASHYSPSSRGRSYRPAAEGRAAAADHKKGSGDEHRELLERIRSLYGHARGPSEAVLGDPAAARGFLEGFALGDRLRESAGRAERRRSRSPKGARDDRDRRSGRDYYRERSAARRADGK
ncbi:uncharacterized protein PG986_002306 [Apiospora aurea]|uniref:Uncharacterized protein n=1 Tax=Apiospora aurea TaxID=335848 RepID=A0ABR1QZH8_9PEZI